MNKNNRCFVVVFSVKTNKKKTPLIGAPVPDLDPTTTDG